MTNRPTNGTSLTRRMSQNKKRTTPSQAEEEATNHEDSPTASPVKRKKTFVDTFHMDVQSIEAPGTADDIRRIWTLYQTLLFVYSQSIQSEEKSIIERIQQRMAVFTEDTNAHFGVKSVCDSLDEKLAGSTTTEYKPLDGYTDYTINPDCGVNWRMVKDGEKLLGDYCLLLAKDPSKWSTPEMLQSVKKAHDTLKDCYRKILQGNINT